MSEGSGAAAKSAEGGKAAPAKNDPGGNWLKPTAIAVVGGLLTAGLVATALPHLTAPSSGTPSTLAAVAQSDLGEATLALDAVAGKQALDDARACRAPLAYLTVQAAPGEASSSIKIRSGSYLSPSLVVSDVPRRIAIPFPAPYPTGHGALQIEGAAKNLRIWLAPVWSATALSGTAQINVIWTPGNPCL